MRYHQLTSEERYEPRELSRHRSTIGREIQRNAREDGGYRPSTADDYARARRWRSRRNWHFTEQDFALVREKLLELWSPEQIAGRLREQGKLFISHETIYRYVWNDWLRGGTLRTCLRSYQKNCRKRYGSYELRGRVEGKRHISERPAGANNRSRFGHLEGDTVMGGPDQHCIMVLVDRKSGYVWLGKMPNRTARAATRCTNRLIRGAKRRIHTLTLDNGTEFHDYKDIEEAVDITVFFATPHHSWERGTCENTNGLIRQYLPKRQSMARLTQKHCNQIAQQLNDRPRKRLGFHTPREIYEKSKS
jgi:IS30 family transposase